MQICPVKAIIMEEDVDGYRYPRRDMQKCIQCNLCEQRCPVTQKTHTKSTYEKKAYMAIHKDMGVLEKSASGGAFVAIASAFAKANEKWVIFGVQYEEKFEVCHTYVTKIEEIKKYQKSKYVQSNTKNTYRECQEYLQLGYRVLYTGTPCEIAGLKSFLNREYDGLYTVDLVCHGAPSQKIFDLYVKMNEEKYNEKIEKVIFRYKKKDIWGKVHSRNIMLQTNKRKVIKSADTDIFLRGYSVALFYRPYCYNCRYACPDRVSDVTIGDFWNIQNIYPEYEDYTGVSGIMLNTKKGSWLISKLKNEMLIKPTEAELFIKYNTQLRKPAKLHPNRDKFFMVLREKGFEEAVNACTRKISPLKLFFKILVPGNIKAAVKKHRKVRV